MIFQYIATFLLCLSLVLQIAVDRAPDITESHDNMAARKVLIVGLLLLCGHLIHLCWTGTDARQVPLIAVTMIAFAEVAFCVNRLFPTVFVQVSSRFHLGGKNS